MPLVAQPPRASPQNSQSLTFSSFSFFSWKGQLSPFCLNLATYYLTSYHRVLRIQHFIIHLIPCIYIGGSASHDNVHDKSIHPGKSPKSPSKKHTKCCINPIVPITFTQVCRFFLHQTTLLCKLQPCGLLESKIQVNYEETKVQRSTTKKEVSCHSSTRHINMIEYKEAL